MKLYHITKSKYLTSILKNGLKINTGNSGIATCRRSDHFQKIYGVQPIFLTDDVDYIKKEMLTKEWIKKYKAVILEVDVDLTETNHSVGWYDGVDMKPKELRYFNNIDISKIDLIKLV